MRKFFIHNGVKEEGPFSIAELAVKNITIDTPIWYQGLEKWTTAGRVEELQSLLVPKVTPPPFKKSPSNPPPANPAKTPSTIKTEKKSRTWVYLVIVLVLAAFLAYEINESGEPEVQTEPEISTEDVVADSSAAPEAEERERLEKERQEEKLKTAEKELRNAWARYLWAEPDDYEESALGGISQLEAIVINKMAYPVDEVKIAVKYIKESGETFKTEYVKVYNIPAEGKASMPAPDSNRGTKIEMEIVGVKADKLNFCYDKAIDARGIDDPYFCR